MPLTPGTRLGVYEVVSAIGAGGMGEVYRATDTKLKRQVAIKILPAAVATDHDRLARFQREAEVLASLNHPHISQIYGLDRQERQEGLDGQDGTTFIVMELVDGEDLSQRIARGAIPIDEALPIAQQIADALEAAHEQGIVHRDLKPANIKVRADGRVKVLDFGLAKAIETGGAGQAGGAAHLSMSPTITTPAMTMAGTILGTAAYMAPEQARGRSVDKRADVWAFGAVLFEMLTTRRAFPGEDITDTIVSIVSKEPDWSALPPGLPSAAVSVLRRCLEKDPARRLRDIREVRLQIEQAIQDPAPAPTPAAAIVHTRERWLWAAAMVAGIIGAGAISYELRPPAIAPKSVRFEVPVGLMPNTAVFAVSPDGQYLAYAVTGTTGTPMLWVRRLSTVESREIPGTEGANQVLWSPDSRTIAYLGPGNKLLKVGVNGGRPEVVANGVLGRCAWGGDSVILCSAINRIIHVFPASGGPGRPVVDLDKETEEGTQMWPSLLPDADHFVYLSRKRNSGEGSVRLASIAGRSSRPLLAADSNAIFAGGFLLFARDATLMAQRFDAERLQLRGDPFPLADNISLNHANGRAAFDVSAEGTLVYRTGADESKWRLNWVGLRGETLASITPPGQSIGPALSPDGSRVAFHRAGVNAGDIWIADASGEKTSRLTFEPSRENASPVWSPDGRRIVFRAKHGDQWGLYEKSSDGVGAETLLTESPLVKSPMSWSPDGQVVLFMVAGAPTGWDIWAMSIGDRKAAAILSQPFNEGHPQLSPDGHWMAYSSNETGEDEVYVQSFPPGMGRWQVSAGSGRFPMWRRDGQQLFFLGRGQPSTAFVVDVRANGKALDFSAPRALFDAPIVSGPISGYTGNYIPWAVSADGRRFLIQQLEVAAESRPSAITVLVNWIPRDK